LHANKTKKEEEKKAKIVQEEYYKQKRTNETILYKLNRSLFPASFKINIRQDKKKEKKSRKFTGRDKKKTNGRST
jgi:hypothetical protein